MQRSYAIFEDLLNLEVNTIIKPSMTAEKMPPVPFALLDILQGYGSALASFGVPVGKYFETSLADCWKHAQDKAASNPHAAETVAAAKSTHAQVYGGAPDGDERVLNCLNDLWAGLESPESCTLDPHAPKFSMAKVHNGWDSFERLRIAALEHIDAITHEHDRVIVTRVVSSCSRLKYLVQGLQQKPPVVPETSTNWLGGESELPYASLAELLPKTRNQLLGAGLRHKRIPQLLRSEDLSLVRKCWEVGVERVMMQTSVQIDGDVVTRIADELIHHHAEQTRALVMDAHKRSVEIGIEQWKALVQVAIELVGKVFGKS